jgi:hypothetical protein
MAEAAVAAVVALVGQPTLSLLTTIQMTTAAQGHLRRTQL